MIRSIGLIVATAVGLMLASVTAADSTSDALSLETGLGRAGVGFFSPHQWGLVRSTIANGTNREQSPLLTIWSKGGENIQFGRELWLPPQSRLSVLTPIKVLRKPTGKTHGLDATAELLTHSEGRQVTAAHSVGLLMVREGGFETAVIAGSDENKAVSMCAALRKTAGLPTTTSYLSPSAAPPLAAGWETIDTLMLATSTPSFDPAQIEALRQWLVDGGRLWLVLDRTPADFARQLLGDHWNVAVVDRVGLTDFQLERIAAQEKGKGAGAKGGKTGGEPSYVQDEHFDYPIDMVRIIAPNMQELASVNGYPAALRESVGKGEVLITTLNAAAWLNDGKEATPALGDLTWFMQKPTDESAASDPGVALMSPVASRQIGYSILSRAPVMIILLVFIAALLCGGLLLAHQKRLAHLGWAAPAMAVIAAAVIVSMGLSRQSNTPFTLGQAQLVHVLPGQPYAKVTSVLSIYTPPGTPREQATLRGSTGTAWPDLSTHGGELVRVMWEGLNQWRFAGLTLRDGAIQKTQLHATVGLNGPADAVVRFTDQGIAGSIEASDPAIQAIENPVILTPRGKISLAVESEQSASLSEGPAKKANSARSGPSSSRTPPQDRLSDTDSIEFTAPYIDPLGPEQFFAGRLLGQEQIARQRTYRSLLARKDFPDQPVLVGWSHGLDLGVKLSDQAVRRTSALVILPVRFETPAPGTLIKIPAALLAMSPFRGPGAQGAPIYDERNHEWVTNISNPSTAMMQFQLPAAVWKAGTFKVESARLVFDLHAPGRPYDVMIYRNRHVQAVQHGQNAAGRIVVTLTGQDAPRVNDDGAVVVGVRVGAANDPTQAQAWSLTRMELGVAGAIRP